MASDVTGVQEMQPERVERAQAADGAWVAIPLVGVIGVACGLSPLFGGFYALSTWGVIALAMLAIAGGLALGGQSGPRGLALAALVALVALAGIALLSV